MSFKIGFIGAGNMGGALINGIIRADIAQKDDIFVYDKDAEKVESFCAQGFNACASTLDTAKKSDYVFLCVKPQNYEEVLLELKDDELKDKVFITIAAGISIAYIKNMLGFDAKVIRVMPNTPLLIGYGASAISTKEPVSQEEFDFVKDIFATSGICEVIDESLMNEIISINGSSPAYFYYFIDIMANFADSRGIDKEVATRLIVDSMIGSAKMVVETAKTPTELINMVTSPGGTTLEAMKVFYDEDIKAIFEEAMTKCNKRADELGR